MNVELLEKKINEELDSLQEKIDNDGEYNDNSIRVDTYNSVLDLIYELKQKGD